jgi:outer membrane biosynthesis protein TonB
MFRIGVIIALLVVAMVAGLAQEASGPVPQNQASQMPRMIRVSGAVMVGMIEHKALPEYPDQALRTGVEGDVIFKIVVDETGKIVLSEPVEGDALLVAASVDALRDLRFRPYQLNGTPTSVETQIGFHFGLSGKSDQAKGQVNSMSRIPYRLDFRTGVRNAKGTFVLWPRKVSGPEPRLPPELVGKSASVYLTLTVGVDGKVQDVKVVGGPQPFVDPVVAAVKQFVYEPQLVDGKPSVATVQASYHFGPPR